MYSYMITKNGHFLSFCSTNCKTHFISTICHLAEGQEPTSCWIAKIRRRRILLNWNFSEQFFKLNCNLWSQNFQKRSNVLLLFWKYLLLKKGSSSTSTHIVMPNESWVLEPADIDEQLGCFFQFLKVMIFILVVCSLLVDTLNVEPFFTW